MSKQDRQGVRTPADLERKYGLGSLGKSFAEAIGMSTDTRATVERVESELRDEILMQVTSLTRNTEQVIMAALESYVEKTEHDEFSQTVQSELLVMADKISMNFSETIAQLENSNSDLQAVIESMQKHFEFSADGLLIKAGENAMALNLDNDIVRFLKGDQQFGWWDGVSFHTGNIYVGVDEIAQFGNYAFVPYADDETDGLDFVRVGG